MVLRLSELVFYAFCMPWLRGTWCLDQYMNGFLTSKAVKIMRKAVIPRGHDVRKPREIGVPMNQVMIRMGRRRGRPPRWPYESDVPLDPFVTLLRCPAGVCRLLLKYLQRCCSRSRSKGSIGSAAKNQERRLTLEARPTR